MLSSLKHIPRTHLFLLASLFLLAALIARGPDLYAHLTTPPGDVFSGQSSWYDPWDLNVYFSAINYGQDGHLFYLNRYDSTATTPVPAYLTYTLLGYLTQWTTLSPQLTFHLAGTLLTIPLLLTIYRLTSLFPETKQVRLLTTTLAFLGGGLGALFYPNHILPDLGQPQFTFFSPLRNPHDALSLTSMLIAIGIYYKITNKKDSHPACPEEGGERNTPLTRHPERNAVKSKDPSRTILNLRNLYFILFTSSLIMTIIHPFLILPLGLLFLTWSGLKYLDNKDHSLFTSLLILGASAIIYYLTLGQLLLNDPSTSGLKASNLPSPNILYILLGYGHFLPFLLIGLNKHRPHKSFISCWFTVLFISTYIPITYQRLFIRSLWFPAIALSLVGFNVLLKKYPYHKKLLTSALILLSLYTPLFITYQTIQNRTSSQFVYLPQTLIESFNYLNQQPPTSILAFTNTANLIPVYTHHRVWAGHPYVTPNFPTRNQASAMFYHQAFDSEQLQSFLKESHIDYIYWSDIERQALGFPQDQPFPYPNIATLAFEKDGLQLYKINKDLNPNP